VKCVRIVGQGIPVRMSDADAHTIVAIDSDGEYCPKSVWKSYCDGEYMQKHGGRPAGRAYLAANGRITRMEWRP
jgi:hypothetical protein